MNNFIFEQLELSDALLIKPTIHMDLRGSFVKYFEKELFLNKNIKFSIYEEFVSISNKNVLRGLHFQYFNPQTKLVTVLRGGVDDVIVDLRKHSKTFMKYLKVSLNEDNHSILYIPKGFAHGFLSNSDNTIMLYLCDGAYDKTSDTGIVYNDKTLNIDWKIDNNKIVISDRDLKLLTFKQFLEIKNKDVVFE